MVLVKKPKQGYGKIFVPTFKFIKTSFFLKNHSTQWGLETAVRPTFEKTVLYIFAASQQQW